MLRKVTANTPTYKVALISPHTSATSTSLRLGWELMKEKNGEVNNRFFSQDWLINHILVSDKEYTAEDKKRSIPSSTLENFFEKLLG
jgi:hypothetical protein